MKKLLTILCTLLIALSIASFSPVKKVEAETCPFVDLSSSQKEAVSFLYFNGITSGTSYSSFSPGRPVTRAEFVTFLWRMAGSPNIITANPFSDVYSSDYYYKAVLWAVANNVTSGREPGKFVPKENVTYQEVFAFIHFFSSRVVGREYANKSKYRLNDPSNYNKYSSWAKEHVHWAYYNGIAYGVSSNNVFKPKDNATRGDVAMFLYNYYKSFQNRYALLVGNGREGGTWLSSDKNIRLMKDCLSDNMTMTKIKAYNSVTDSNTFASYMSQVFSGAACIDVCYIYLTCHGSTAGLTLYTSDPNAKLTPNYLANQVGKYKGHFTIMIDSCYSGVFAEYFAAINEKNIDILTSADSSHLAMNYNSGTNVGGVATIEWVKYIAGELNRQKFVSLREVWYNTKTTINNINEQNPSFYGYKNTYVSFTKSFN